MKLSGKAYSKEQLVERIGHLRQIGGTRSYTLTDGASNNVRAIDVNTGSGLTYSVLLDRGMDISLASFKGRNLVYLTGNNEVHPAFYDDRGLGWLRSFGGGLLTTCGLTHLGPPCTDEGEELGLHGRYSNTPAQQVCDNSGWHNGKYVIRLSGIVEEAALFNHKLRLTRTLISTLGESSILIEDSVENFGFKPSPLTILYHFNLGFPLLDTNSKLSIGASKSEPRDAEAKKGISRMFECSGPVPGFKEQVFSHTMRSDAKGGGAAILVNPNLDDGLALALRFSSKALPFLTEWKMMGQGEYVVGLEPCNVRCQSRADLRKNKLLPMLKPGEIKTFSIRVDILSGMPAIRSFMANQELNGEQ